MKFLTNWRIDLAKVPAYVEFNQDFTEHIDCALADIILATNDDDIAPESKEQFRRLVAAIDRRKNELSVKYSGRKGGLGRRYADCPDPTFPDGRPNPRFKKYCSALITMSRKIKNTIYHYQGWRDYDQVKGHATILYEVGLRNRETFPGYEDYLKPGRFDEIAATLIAFYSGDEDEKNHLTKKDIKWLFNKTIYGGGFKEWVKDIQTGKKKDNNGVVVEVRAPKEVSNPLVKHPIYLAFFEDTKKIINLVYVNNSPLVAVVCDNLPDTAENLWFRKNRTMSYFCGILENELTFQAYKYAYKNDMCKQRKVSWALDGFTIPPPPAYFDEAFHLSAMNEFVREKTGFTQVRFIRKEFEADEILQSCIDLRRSIVDAVPAIMVVEGEAIAEPPEPTEKDEAYMVWKEKFEKEWCKIKNTATFMRAYCEEGIFKRFIFQDKKKLVVAYENECYKQTQENGKTKKVKYITEWLEDPTQLVFEDAGVYPPPLICPPGVFNLWKPSPYEMQPFTGEDDPEIDKDAVKRFITHIDIICGGDKVQTDWLCSWFAHSLQKPCEKPEHALNLIGNQGIGKSTILNTFSKLYGAGKTLETQTPERDVWGGFNSAMTNSFLVILSETDKRNAFGADGKIKALITDYPMWINPKGKDQFEINSYHRVVQLTNIADPAKTSKDDRRNWILRCSDELKGNAEYFIAINAALARPNALRSIYWSFKIFDISQWNFRNVPRTKYHETIIEHTKNPMLLFLEAFTLQRLKMTECVMTGCDLLAEFRAWREATKYKFEDNMNEGMLLKKIKTECDLPADAIVRGARTRDGYKQTFHIGVFKQHLGLGCLILAANGDFVEETKPEAEVVGKTKIVLKKCPPAAKQKLGIVVDEAEDEVETEAEDEDEDEDD